MVLEGGGQFLARHARLQRLRVEVGGDQREGVVVPIGVRRRARAEVDPRFIVLLPPTNLSEGLLARPRQSPSRRPGCHRPPYADTPAGARPSGSNSNSAKLLVPSGTFDQASGGEMFSPTQFGLRCLSLHAFLTARMPLS